MSNNRDLYFQLFDFYTENMFENINELNDDIDENDSTSDSSDESENEEEINNNKNNYDNNSVREYKIYLFGKTENKKSICVMVHDFTPYYYIRVPNNWNNEHKYKFVNWILNNIDMKYRDGFIRFTSENKKHFRGFTNEKKYNFVRLFFKNTTTLNKTLELFVERYKLEPHICRQLKIDENEEFKRLKIIDGIQFKNSGLPIDLEKTIQFQPYESTLNPLLRFIHIRDILPCGWIKLNANSYTINTDKLKQSKCELDISVSWTNVNKCDRTDNMPFEVCSFDIECDSSHGDFPLAKKDYLKSAREIIDYWNTLIRNRDNYRKIVFESDNVELKETSKTKLEIIKKQLDNPEDTIYKMLDIMFYNEQDENSISVVYTKLRAKPSKDMLKAMAKKIIPFATITYNKDNNIKKNTNISKITRLFNKNFPSIEGDQVRQIGISFIKYGETRPYKNFLLSWGSCDSIKNTEVLWYDSEEELLLGFTKLINVYNPDLITGYNIFNFDFPFLYWRAEELGIVHRFAQLGRLNDKLSNLIEKKGKVKTLFLEMIGRVQLDILKLLQRDYTNLDSYTLDNVSSKFIKSKISKIIKTTNYTKIITDNVKGLNVDNWIHIAYVEGYSETKLKEKFIVKKINKVLVGKKTSYEICISDELELDYKNMFWTLAKDDMDYKELFKLFKRTSADRALVGKYCVMDVILCIELILKLQLMTNYMGMANVCYTPLSWIYMRGQGIKITSLVSKECRLKNYLLPTLFIDPYNREKYEGAYVLTPKPQAYLDEFITVLDFNSLYPSSMIAENISHETYAMKQKWLGEECAKRIKELGLEYVDIPHDKFELTYTNAGAIKTKTKVGENICRFIQYPNKDGKECKGIIPNILKTLLKARKDTRTKAIHKVIRYLNDFDKEHELSGLIIDENDDNLIIIDSKTNEKIIVDKNKIISKTDKYNDFEQSVFEGLQLAYKVTANSLYGQIGAKVSDIYLKDVAASTTATGRGELMKAKRFVEQNYGADVVYGDTDSIFVNYKPKDRNGNPLRGREGLIASMNMGRDTSIKMRKILKSPQNLAYEKTFWPFMIFSKKRYVGNKYEENPDSFYQASMGTVDRRRDNAPIVKTVYNGTIDILMNKLDIMEAYNYLMGCCWKLANDKYPMSKLIITKKLNAHYKKPEQISHKMLADRIGERDPGNKPKAGDRIPYVCIIPYNNSKKNILQSDRIENPDYVLQNNIKLDYRYYITNQISKPISSIFALFIEKIDPTHNKEYFDKYYNKQLKQGKNEDDAYKKTMDEKRKIANKYLFDRTLVEIDHKTNHQQTITNFFGKK